MPITGDDPWIIRAWLHDQVLGSRFASELFQVDTPEVNLLRTLHEGVNPVPETLATAVWEGR